MGLSWKHSSPGTREGDKGVFLVATYHPLLQNINRTFDRHLDLLYTDQEVESVFTPGPMASSCSARKISSYLVRAKLYPLERRVDFFKCRGRGCQVFLNVTAIEAFTSTSTNQTYKINHELNCNESSLNHLLTLRSAVSSMLDKQLISFTVDGIIIKVMTLVSPVCKNTYFSILTVSVRLAF